MKTNVDTITKWSSLKRPNLSFQTVDQKPISGDTLTKAVSALGAFLNLREFGERVFNDLSDTW
jgi:hypothetical protein